jgi:hypothetical protein
MSISVTEIQRKRDLRLSRVCWALAAVFALLSLTVLLFIPEVSVLSQPDGTKYFYVNRQVDLPTGDPAVFSDYSMMPLSGIIAACSIFYMTSGAWLRGRQANQPLQATAAPRGF